MASTFDLVSERFELSETFATQAFEDAQALIETLANSFNDVDLPLSQLDYTIPAIVIDDITPVGPDAPNTTVVLPVDVQSPDLASVLLDDIEVPQLDVVAPSLNLPETPDLDFPTPPGDAPILSDPEELPTKPTFVLPDVPIIDQIAIPAAPTFTLPAFEGVAPVDNLMSPANIYVYNEVEFQNDLKDALQAYYLDIVQNGGDGLGSEAEAAIFARAVNRRDLINEREINELFEAGAAMGWNIPAGSIDRQHKEILDEQTRAEAQLNYEITIEQARLAQRNTEIALTEGNRLIGELLTNSNFVAQRAFESAKYAQDVAINLVNSDIAIFNSRTANYQVHAQVYESRIRAALLELEKFKLELEAKRLEADIQEQLITIYIAQVESVKVLMQMYTIEMENAKLKTEIERTRIDAFRATVDAYIAQVNGNTARYNAFNAQLSGEESRMRVYNSQVDAYRSAVAGAAASADISIAEANVTVSTNEQLISQYRADIENYNQKVRAAISDSEFLTAVYRSNIEKYDADIRSANAKMSTSVESQRGVLEHEANQLRIELEEANINLTGYLTSESLRLRALETGTSVSAQLAASSMSAVNAGATQNFSGSESDQHFYDETKEVIETRIIINQ